MTRLDAAGVLFTHPGNLSVLLVKPFYKPYWDLPGGKVEDGEFEAQAARREVAEELGLNIPHRLDAHLLVADWLHATETRPAGMRWVFDGGPLRMPLRELTLQASEIEQAEWHMWKQAQAATAEAPMLQRRIRAAMEAAQWGTTALMVDGAAVMHLPRHPSTAWVSAAFRTRVGVRTVGAQA